MLVRLLVAIYRKFKLNEWIHTFQVCTHVKARAQRRHEKMMNLEQRRLKLTHAWQLRTMTDKGRLLTGGTVKSHTVVEFTSGKDRRS